VENMLKSNKLLFCFQLSVERGWPLSSLTLILAKLIALCVSKIRGKIFYSGYHKAVNGIPPLFCIFNGEINNGGDLTLAENMMAREAKS